MTLSTRTKVDRNPVWINSFKLRLIDMQAPPSYRLHPHPPFQGREGWEEEIMGSRGETLRWITRWADDGWDDESNVKGEMYIIILKLSRSTNTSVPPLTTLPSPLTGDHGHDRQRWFNFRRDRGTTSECVLTPVSGTPKLKLIWFLQKCRIL